MPEEKEKHRHALCFGDTIGLFSVEEGGYISAGGFIDNRIWLDVLYHSAACPPSLRDIAFTITSKYDYRARRATDAYIEHRGLSRDEIMNNLEHYSHDVDISALLERESKEARECEEADEKLLYGSVVAYGSVVQLKHKPSGKFVTISRTVAEYDRSSLSVSLELGGGEGSWFQVMPAYKTKSEGSVVRLSDVVIFHSNLFPGNYLHTGYVDWSLSETKRKLPLTQTSREVNASSITPVECRVVALGREWAAEPGAHLKGTTVVTLYHKHTGSFLAYFPNDDVAFDEGSGLTLKRAKGSSSISKSISPSYWVIEPVEIEWSARSMRWVRKFRLKHYATGMYLCVKKAFISDAGQDFNVVLFMSMDPSVVKSTWRFRPFQDQQVETNERIAKDSNVYIVDDFYGTYLHDCGVLGRNYKFRGVDSAIFHDVDVFVVSEVKTSCINSTTIMMRSMDVFRNFSAAIKQRNKDDVANYARKSKRAYSLLVRLLMLMVDSDDADPFVRFGTPNKYFQKLFREFNGFDILMDMICAPFSQGINRVFHSESNAFADSIYHPKYEALLNINILAYRVILMALEENGKNKSVYSRHLSTVVAHVGGPMNAGAVMTNLFANHRDLLINRVNEEFVERVCSFIRDGEGKMAKYLDFLASICVWNGEGIFDNQNLVVKAMFDYEDWWNEQKTHRDRRREERDKIITHNSQRGLRRRKLSWAKALKVKMERLQQKYADELEKAKAKEEEEEAAAAAAAAAAAEAAKAADAAPKDDDDSPSTLETVESGVNPPQPRVPVKPRAPEVDLAAMEKTIEEMKKKLEEIDLDEAISDDEDYDHDPLLDPQENETPFTIFAPNSALFLEVKVIYTTVGKAKKMFDYPPKIKLPSKGSRDIVLAVRERGHEEWIYCNAYMGLGDNVVKQTRATCYEDRIMQYFVSQIHLIGCLLVSRNRLAFDKLVRIADLGLRYQELVDVVFHERIPYIIRRNLCQVLLHLYIERDPCLPKNPIMYSKISKKLSNPPKKPRKGPSLSSKRSLSDRPSLSKSSTGLDVPADIGSKRTSRDGSHSEFSESTLAATSNVTKVVKFDHESDESSEEEHYSDDEVDDSAYLERLSPFSQAKYAPFKPVDGFQDFKKAVRKFLETAKSLNQELYGKNLLCLQIIEVVHTMLTFGLFTGGPNAKQIDTHDLKWLLPLLMHMLDGRDDLPSGEARYAFTHKNSIIMKIKLQLMKSFDYIFDMRLNVRLGQMFKRFDKKFKRPSGIGKGSLPSAPKLPSVKKSHGRRRQSIVKFNAEDLTALADSNEENEDDNTKGKSDDMDPGLLHNFDGEDAQADDEGGEPTTAVEDANQPEKIPFKKRMASLASLLIPKSKAPPPSYAIEQRTSTNDDYKSTESTQSAWKVFSESDLNKLERTLFDRPMVHAITDLPDHSPAIDIYLDLLRYENPELQEHAFESLLRHLQQRVAFVRGAVGVQPLHSYNCKSTMDKIRRSLQEMSYTIKWLMNSEGFAKDPYKVVTEEIRFLRGLVSLEQHSANEVMKNQTLMKNAYAHEVLYRILRLPMPLEKGMVPKHPERRDLMQEAYHLLTAMCTGNKDVQQELSKDIELLGSHMGVDKLNCANTIVAIVQDNRETGDRIGEDILRKFFQLIIRYGKNPRWLRIFNALMVCDRVPHNDRQREMLSLLLEHKGISDLSGCPRLCELDADIAGQVSSDELVDRGRTAFVGQVLPKALDVFKENMMSIVRTKMGLKGVPRLVLLRLKENRLPIGSRVVYHRLYLETLAATCYGKLRANEAKVRALFPFEELMKQLLYELEPTKGVCEDDIRFVRNGYVRLIHRSWVETNHPGARDMVSRLYNGLFRHSVTTYPDKEPLMVEIARSCRELLARTKKGHVENDETGLIYHSEYIFDTCAPFVRDLLWIHGNSFQGEEEGHINAQEVAKSLYDSLQDLVLAEDHWRYMTQQQYENAVSCGRVLAMFTGSDPFQDWGYQQKVKTTSSDYRKWGGDPDLVYGKAWKDVVRRFAVTIGVKDLKRMIGKGLRNLSELIADRPLDAQRIVKFLNDNHTTLKQANLITGLRLIRGVIYVRNIHTKALRERDWMDFVASDPTQRSPESLHDLQVTLLGFGGHGLVMELVASDDDDVRLAAIRLMCVLLQNHFKDIQDTFSAAISTRTKFFEGCFRCFKRANADIERMKKQSSGVLSVLTKKVPKNDTKEEFDESELAQAESKRSKLLRKLHLKRNKVIPRETSVASNDPMNEETGYVYQILTILELLCAQRHVQNQSLMIFQRHCEASYDLMTEIVNYGLALQSELDSIEDGESRVVMLFKQVFTTLHSIVQGPNTETMQMLLAGQFFELFNRVVDRLVDFDHHVHNDDINSIMHQVNVLLLSLLEAHEEYVCLRILGSTDWEKYYQMYEKRADAVLAMIPKTGFVNSRQQKFVEEVNMYRFIVHMVSRFDKAKASKSGTVHFDRCTNTTDGNECSRNARIRSLCLTHCFEGCRKGMHIYHSYSSSVEIIREGRVESMFFSTVPIQTQLQTFVGVNAQSGSLRTRLEEYYDENPAVRLQDFMHDFFAYVYEKNHSTYLNRNVIGRVVVKTYKYVREAPFYLALLINFVIVTTMDTSSVGGSSSLPDFELKSATVGTFLVHILGAIHFIASCIMLIFYLITRGSPEAFHRMNDVESFSSSPFTDISDSRPLIFKWPLRTSWLVRIYHLMKLRVNGQWRFQVLYMLLYPLFSLLGQLHPFAFIYHLLDLFRDPITRIVLRSVTDNANKLWRTLVTSILIIYLFSCVGFIAYRDKEGASSLWYLFYYYLWSTAAQSNILSRWGTDFEFPNDPYVGVDQWYEMSTATLSTLFAFVLVLVVLAIISGIIIDGFGELRDNAQKVLDSMDNTCYICGLDRHFLDRHGNGLESHIQREHPVVAYYHAFMYLERKAVHEMTTQERYVLEMLLSRDIDIFPIGRTEAITHNEGDELKEALMVEIGAQIDEVRKNINEKFDNFDKRMKSQMAEAVTTALAGLTKGKDQNTLKDGELDNIVSLLSGKAASKPKPAPKNSATVKK